LLVKGKTELNSCDLLGQGRGDIEEGVGLGALEDLVVFEHAEDGVQEFTHGGDQGLEFGFAAPQQVLVESAQVGLVDDGDQSADLRPSGPRLFLVFLSDLAAGSRDESGA
jgi:hypothetical protein